MRGWDSSIRVLHVDDDPEMSDLAAQYLEREDDRFTVLTAASAADGPEVLAEDDVDCVVSDHDMPGLTGIEFLESVRERHPDLPFVLFTGKGSEEVASKAISAGVTDYLQKETGRDQYTILANRVANAVEQYRAERVVERSERRLRTVIDRIPHPVFVVDANERYLLSNEAHARGHGTTASEIEGTAAEDVLEAAFYEQFSRDLAEVLETGEPIRVPDVVAPGENGPTYYDSRLYPFDSFRESTRAVLGVVVDVTERKRREQTLEALHGVTRELLGADSETEVVDLIVDALEETLGYRTNVVRLVSDDGTALRPVAKSDEAASILGDRPVYAVGDGPPGRAFETSETRVYDDVRSVADGYDRGSLRSVMYVPIDGHGVLSIGETEVGVFDELDVHLAEVFAANAAVALDLVEQARARDREHERLEEFASIVSHDLRNPLGTLSASLDLAERHGDSGQFARCRRAVDRMDRLIDDLLTLARQGEIVAETDAVPLAPLARDVWAHTGSDEATLAVETDQVLRADPDRLRQVLDNLLTNAVDHAGPDVAVTVGSLPDESCFYVEEDGPGIQPENRDRVFESAFSTSDMGTGYGLRIVRRIAEAHGWSVEVTEGTAGGARFEVTGVDVASAA